ncbi:MAG TPA: hypothetical protein P5186_21570 [Candidatus Paceibacterota bacterium]|nr:hypothetical protein [Candidatus Paceibacterota bacterium]
MADHSPSDKPPRIGELQKLPPILESSEPKSATPRQPAGLSKRRILLAFAIAALSDLASIGSELVPPLQWSIDITTALLLFVVLGWRWFILPGLIAEAIPGIALFPTWVLVVASVAAWGHLNPNPQKTSD